MNILQHAILFVLFTGLSACALASQRVAPRSSRAASFAWENRTVALSGSHSANKVGTSQ